MDTSIDIDQKNVVDLKSKSKVKPNLFAASLQACLEYGTHSATW